MAFSLTEPQESLLTFIKQEISATGRAPSVQQMADELGYASKGNVHRLLVCLEDRGAIRRLPYRARAIELTPSDDASLDVETAIRALNEAAHAAEKAARKSGDPRASVLRNFMWQTDAYVDGCAKVEAAK